MKKYLLVLIAALLAALFVVPKAQAGVNDFVINDFRGRYELFNDVHSGRMAVTENLDVTYSDMNHGILRAIPLTYKKNSLQLEVQSVKRDGVDEPYTTYNENDNKVLKIGDAGRTITAKHTYEIQYTMRGIMSFYEGYDEFYLDINGDQWAQPFDTVSAEVIFPEGWKSEGVPEPSCYTGQAGSTEKTCIIEKIDRGYIYSTGRSLQPRETLTVVATTPKGLFVPRDSGDWWRDNYGKILAVVIPPLLVGPWAFRRWQKHGKDAKGRGVIIPEYSPPKLTPAEASVVYSYRLSTTAVSATIVDLAIRGYLKIIETKEKKILKDKLNYEFEVVRTDWDELKPHEAKIMSAILAEVPTGKATTVSLDMLKKSFYKTVTKLQGDMPKQLASDGYFTSNPASSGTRMWVVFAILIGLMFVIHSWLSLGLLLAAVIVATFAVLMPKRTQLGADTKDALEGLKLYMNTAEKDRIKMLQSPDAPYAKDYHEPKKTVDLFEKLLPFAILLEVENQWAGQFANIYKTPPDWYGGNWTAFSAAYLASSVTGSVNAMSSNFSPPSSSGGSGSGGGGFSGGGGGGGGGGGW